MWGAVFSSLGQEETQMELWGVYLTLTSCVGLWGL